MGLEWGLRRLVALLRLARPLNGFLAAAGALTGMALAAGSWDALARPAFFVAPLAALLITGFGNVLNDLRDVAVDRVAHPRRPLAAGVVTRRSAWRLMALLLSAGLAAALLAGWLPFAISCAAVATLLLYELRLKRRGLAGNTVVAALTASTFVYGASAQGVPLAFLPWVAALMAFFVNLAREVTKDAEDVDADRPHRRTLPMALGVRSAGTVAAAAAAVAVLASWPFVRLLAAGPCGGAVGAGTVVASDVVVLAGAMLAPFRAGLAQRALKLGMLVAVAGFALAAASGWPVASCP